MNGSLLLHGRRVQSLLSIGAALLLAVGSISLARRHSRPEPKPEEPPPGVRIEGDAFILTPNAPSRAFIATHAPAPPEPQWGDPIPARIVFDESKTSRVGAPLAGRVTVVQVERGQTVKRGDVLFKIASAQLAELVADRQRAEVELTTAKVNLDRVRRAIEAGALPQKELIGANQQFETAKVTLDLANERYRTVTDTGGGQTELVVKAPRDGIVVERAVTPGQSVSPDSGSMLAIADLSSVWVLADVFDNVDNLHVGMAARVLQPTLGASYDATVDQVAPVVDPDLHGVAIRINLANPTGMLRPNAFLQVQLSDPTPTVAKLPETAVLTDGDQSYVYVEKPAGTFKRRNVQVTSAHDEHVAVISGLALDDVVVTYGAILIDNAIALAQAGGS
jgi:RND family efflux transporter MFP subunit